MQIYSNSRQAALAPLRIHEGYKYSFEAQFASNIMQVLACFASMATFRLQWLLAMYKEMSDIELIQRYLASRDDQAFTVLLRRHYDATYHRFLKHLGTHDDAAELSQQLWLRVANNLESYKDEGKFASYLMRIASNLLTDHWRRKGTREKVIYEASSDDEHEMLEQNTDNKQTAIDLTLSAQEEVSHLTNNLIPQLPVEQRLTFLIKHESEFWDDKQRLDWPTLAALNGMSVEELFTLFDSCRNDLIKNARGEAAEISEEALMVFLIWTQAQRLDKKTNFTWNYYSELLNISSNTLKTRYRAALKSLSSGLEELHL